MNQIQSTLLTLLPSKRKSTPSGWISFNAVCCHHRGEKTDTRSRGGLLINGNTGWQYHCFNCNFKAGWSQGKLLSNNTKMLFKWLGLNDIDLGKLNLAAMKLKEQETTVEKIIDLNLQTKTLPEFSLPITEWANSDLPEETYNEFVEVINYINQRGMSIDWYPWYWSPTPGFKDRLLIPFYQNQQIVGYTARKIKDGKPKYLTDAQPGYVFNIDKQNFDKQFVIVVEGQFDAIAIDGCAIMHNEPNDTQVTRINALRKEVIVVPDKDKAGSKILKSALENNWSVSLPPWEDHIKDVADAVKNYGRLYTLFTILHYKESNKIKIELLKRKLEKLHA